LTFLKYAFWNSAGNLTRQVALVIQEFGARVFLAPGLIGVWDFANLVRRIGNVFDAGFLAAAQRDLPALRGAGQMRSEIAYRSTTLVTHVGSKLLVAGAALAYVLVSRDRYEPLQEAGFLVGALLLVLFALTEALTTFYQAAERFAALSRATLLYSLAVAAGIASTFLWGIWGLLGANIASAALYGLLLFRSARREGVPIEPFWRVEVFRQQARFALPLRVADYPLGLMAEVDSLMLAEFAGLAPLAVYSTAKIVMNQLVQVTSWLALVVVVRINVRGTDRRYRSTLAQELQRYLLVVDLVLLPIFICAAALAAPMLISRFLPAYAESLDVLPFLLLTVFFVPQNTIVRNLWILDKRIKPIAGSNIVGLASTLSAIGVGTVLAGFTPRVVATGYLAGNCLYYVWIMSLVGRQELGTAGAADTAGHALLACVWTASTLALIPGADGVLQGTNPIRMLGVNLAWAGLMLTPLACYGAWRSQLPQYLASFYRSRQSHEQAAG
jgi:O-antigen/teichoic acid export membrane protein